MNCSVTLVVRRISSNLFLFRCKCFYRWLKSCWASQRFCFLNNLIQFDIQTGALFFLKFPKIHFKNKVGFLNFLKEKPFNLFRLFNTESIDTHRQIEINSVRSLSYKVRLISTTSEDHCEIGFQFERVWKQKKIN